MNTRTQNFVLLLFGGALVRLAISDLLLRYVRPSSRPWVLLAGIALLVLAVSRLLTEHRTGVDRAVATGWLVVAPVVAILVIGPPALGAFSAVRTPAAVTATVTAHKDFPALTGSAPHRLGLLDFTTRVLWDDNRTVTGQDVQLTGFVLGPRPGGFTLARLVITCCAADARPVEVYIRSPSAPPADNSWVTVTGRSAGPEPDAPDYPVLRAGSVTATTAPVNPYDGS